MKFIIKKKGNFYVAYDTVNKSKTYGKININTGKFVGDTKCLVALKTHLKENTTYKFLFIVIEERNGEKEYTFRIVRQVPIDANEDEIAEYEAKTWYGNGEDVEEEDGWYMHDSGAIAVRAESAREISKEDYDVLTQYI